jgi:thioredoxin 1
VIEKLAGALPKGEIVVLVSATWCGNCKAFRPAVESASGRGTRFRFMEVDVDLRPDLIEAWKLESVPTVVLFKDGREVRRQVGFTSEKKLLTFLERF